LQIFQHKLILVEW